MKLPSSIESLHQMVDGFFAANSGAPAAVAPVKRVRCMACGGDGYIENGMDEFSNVGRTYRCNGCNGSGSVDVTVRS